MTSSFVTLFSSFSRQTGNRSGNSSSLIRIPVALVGFFTLALLLSNIAHVTDTVVQNVSSSGRLASLQKALEDGHSRLANYAGQSKSSGSSSSSASTSSSKQKRYIVLPATAANPGFCRTLFALLINDYGPPTVINWGGTAGSNHYAKITAGYDWLHEGGEDDDIVLTIDAHDVWPQVPSDAFFQQYNEYPEHYGAIIGAEKHCYPHPEDHPRCMKLPKSPLPKDVYGHLTDKINATGKFGSDVDIDPDLDDQSSWVWGRYETVRPRYINSGTVVGTRKQLKELYAAALKKMNCILDNLVTVTRLGSDQEILGLVNLDRIESKGRPLLTPDVHLRLFQVMAHSYKDLYPRPLDEVLPELPESQQNALSHLAQGAWADRQLAMNRISNTIPAFIHFAGPKAALEIWWKRTWWLQESENDGDGDYDEDIGRRPVERFLEHIKQRRDEKHGYGIRLANGTWYGFMDLCEEYIPSLPTSGPQE